jgi:hypothetical protein
MKPDVDPQVQQAALKKMFTDPHFNVMDRLDIYIDDYSQPDPLPMGMLERMAQSLVKDLTGMLLGDIHAGNVTTDTGRSSGRPIVLDLGC